MNKLMAAGLLIIVIVSMSTGVLATDGRRYTYTHSVPVKSDTERAKIHKLIFWDHPASPA